MATAAEENTNHILAIIIDNIKPVTVTDLAYRSNLSRYIIDLITKDLCKLGYINKNKVGNYYTYSLTAKGHCEEFKARYRFKNSSINQMIDFMAITTSRL
ncbi:MAG: hypothetical protein DRQ89_13590 [Epsilonproteobacteria bacterium]|nr:MAG: hypothetical protein DRQ89_13590 [Campylobacterota bacterium]